MKKLNLQEIMRLLEIFLTKPGLKFSLIRAGTLFVLLLIVSLIVHSWSVYGILAGTVITALIYFLLDYIIEE